MIILFIGLAVTIISNLSPGNAVNPLLGAILTIISTIFQALFYFTEEIFVRKYEIEPALGVFWERVWGIIESSIVIAIFNFIDDPFNPGHPMENTKEWLEKLGKNPSLLVLHIAYVLIIFVFNLFGFYTTKEASSSARTTFGSVKPFIIWIIGLIIGWEVLDKVETPVKLLGFIIAIAGVLIYNNVWIIIPYFKDKNKV